MVELLQSQAHILGPTGGRFDGGSRVIVLERPSLEENPMDESLVVRREAQIAAPPATVFAFLTDPQKILSWMGAEADTDAHPGGLYLVKDVAGRPGRTARGEFREVVPVHRLAYSFGWDDDENVPPGSSLVE